jgi:hypothetical protein
MKMSETIEISENVRVFIRDLDEAPDSVDLEVADEDDPGEYYYEVPLTELGKRLGKRYIRYDGPEGRGFYDTVRGELRTRPGRQDRETKENAVKNKIFEKAEQLLDKYKIYVSDADTLDEAQQMAPDWANVQVSEQGSFYYEKLPGQGGDGDDDQDLQVGEYDVDTQFGKIVADRVNRDDMGDIPVDDFYEYMDEIDDPQLIKDCLQAEIDGPGRKTGKQFIEQRARALDIDLDLFYKDSGPDKTGDTLTSLSDMGVDIEELSDEIVVSAEENDHTTQDWSVKKLYETYVVGDKGTPSGMGNPDDIPAGTFATVLEEEVDDPAVLMQFYQEADYQVRRDVELLLEEEYGYIAKVEEVDSDVRFDLDAMQEYMDEDEVMDLEEGERIIIDDFNGGFQEAEIVKVGNASLIVQDPHGLGSEQMEVSLQSVFSDEFYLASAFEKDGLFQGALHQLDIHDDIINRIDDDSVLSRAKKWDEGDAGHALRPGVKDSLTARLSELNPPDPEEYDMSEESMNLLHGATWPEWDSEGAKKMGSGISDDLGRVYSETTTEDLRKYKQVCEDEDLEDRAKVVNGMLYYREDSDVGIHDLFEYERTAHGNYSGATEDVEERVMGAAEITMNNIEPHIGAQMAGHIERFELQQPPSGSNWVGQSQSGGRVMAIDDPFNVERTTSHEMGHAFHNFMGIKNDGYGTIDNREESDPMNWQFGAKEPSNRNDSAHEFYEEMKDEWDAYRRTQAGEDWDANEIRSYQKRHGVELMAVGFAHWNIDPYKVRNRHPGLAEVFDKHLGDGVVDPLSPSEVEEGQYYEVAKDNIGRVTVEIKEVYETAMEGQYDYDVKIVDGPQEGTTRTFNSDETVFEAMSDEYEPLDTSHGMQYKVEVGDREEEVYIDRETRAMGGDFMVRDSMGNTVGQWTKDQFERNLIERDPVGEGEIPWSPDKAEKGDLVEMHGVEVNVKEVDDWDEMLVLEDTNGETQTLTFSEVADLRKQGDFEPVQSVVDWEEMSSNQQYQFDVGDANYNGEVVGFDEDSVTIEQGRAGTSTVDRDEVEEIRRRA